MVNYDRPWNPRRIDQRIGRCHRNVLNERNEADRRVHDLLPEKSRLFGKVFGASDEVPGSTESGVDFERRVAIYQQCRTAAETETAFRRLQEEMGESVAARMPDTRRVLLEQFDEDVHGRPTAWPSDTRADLDRVGRMFWTLTRHAPGGRAGFDDGAHLRPP